MPWYTTADARRDAEKQAARRKQEITGNDGMSYTFEIGKSGAVKAIHERIKAALTKGRAEMSGRYEIEDTCPGVIGVKMGTNTWYLDDEQPEAQAIRQLQQDLAAVTAERDAWRRRAEESEPHLAPISYRVEDSPGVQGLVQLGRNAIERVTQLESENAYLRSANSDGAEILQSLRAERDQLRTRLAEIEKAPTVAWQDVHEPQDLYCNKPQQIDFRELIARPKATP